MCRLGSEVINAIMSLCCEAVTLPVYKRLVMWICLGCMLALVQIPGNNAVGESGVNFCAVELSVELARDIEDIG